MFSQCKETCIYNSKQIAYNNNCFQITCDEQQWYYDIGRNLLELLIGENVADKGSN